MENPVQSNESSAAAAVAEKQPETQVPAKVESKPDYTLGLFATDQFLNTPSVARAFGVKAILDRDGNQVGFRTPGKARRDIAKETGLTKKEDKDRLDSVIRQSQEEYFKIFKAWLLLQPDGAVGISRYAFRKDKNGVGTHTVAIRELSDKAKADLQKLADAYGVPMEKLAEFLAQFKKGDAAVEVPATVTVTATEPEPAKPAPAKPAPAKPAPKQVPAKAGK